MDPVLTIATVSAMFGLVYFGVRFSRMRRHDRLGRPEKKTSAEVDLDVRLNASWRPGRPKDVLSCALALGTGTANALYTPVQTLGQGTYLVWYYHCLNAASAEYYVQASAEATAGVITSGTYSKNWSQLTAFSQPPFILKVRSRTADVRFKVMQAAGGTITHLSGSCGGFEWALIGP